MSVSPTSDTPAPDPGRRVQTGLALFFGVACLAVALVYLLLPTPSQSRRVDLRLDSWQSSPEEIAAERERERALLERFEMSAEEEALIEGLGRYGQALETAGGNARDVVVRKVQAELSAELVRYAHKYGVERYHAFGLALRDRFLEALKMLLADVRRSGERTSTYLERHPVSPSVVEFRKVGGGFLPQALRAGLVSDDGRLANGAKRVAGVFFLVRWFAWVQSVTDYTFRLSPSQLSSFWAWKAEQSRNLSVERRMALVAQVVKVRPDYPADYVRGILLARADRWEDAVHYWQRWLGEHPGDRRVRDALRYVDELVGR